MKVRKWAKKLFSSSSGSDSSSTKTSRSIISVSTDLSMPSFLSSHDHSLPSPTPRLYSASTTSSVSSLPRPKKNRIPKFFRNNQSDMSILNQDQNSSNTTLLSQNTVDAAPNGSLSENKNIDLPFMPRIQPETTHGQPETTRVQPETTTIYYEDGLIREYAKQIQTAMGQLTETTALRTETLPLKNTHKETTFPRDNSKLTTHLQNRAILSSSSPRHEVDTRRRSRSLQSSDRLLYSTPLKDQRYTNTLRSENVYQQQQQQHHHRQRAPTSRPEISRGGSYERSGHYDANTQSVTRRDKINPNDAYQPKKTADRHPRCSPSPIKDLKALGPPPTSRPPPSPMESSQHSLESSLDSRAWSKSSTPIQNIPTRNDTEQFANSVGILKAVEDLNRKLDQILNNSADATTGTRFPLNKNQCHDHQRLNEVSRSTHPSYNVADTKASYPPIISGVIGESKPSGRRVHERPPIRDDRGLEPTLVSRNENKDVRYRTPLPPLPTTCQKLRPVIPFTIENESQSRSTSPLRNPWHMNDYFSAKPDIVPQVESHTYKAQGTKGNAMNFNNAKFMNHNNGSTSSLYSQNNSLYQRDDHRTNPSPIYHDRNANYTAASYSAKPNYNSLLPPPHPPPHPPRSIKANESLCGIREQVYLNVDSSVSHTDNHTKKYKI